MIEEGIFTTHRRFKIPRTVSLCVLDRKMHPDNLPNGFILVTEDILQCGIQVLLPYFQNILNYYGVTLIQLSPNSYHHMVTLFVSYKELKFLDLTPEEFSYIYLVKENTSDYGFYHTIKWHSRNVKAFWNVGSNMGQWKHRWFLMESPIGGKFKVASFPHYHH